MAMKHKSSESTTTIRVPAITAFGLVGLTAATIVQPARADDDPWEVRLRGVYLDMANKSDPIPALAVPQNAIHVNSKFLADLDLEYFFTPNWSSELVLTYPQTQAVTVDGTRIGEFKHLPPMLTAKYDFLPHQDFQPYVGVGVNVTVIWDTNLSVPGVGPLRLNSTSVGPAAQAGFDYKIADHWYLNADVKWAKLGSDVDLPGGNKVSTVHLDPFLFGLGVGYRFGGHAPVAAPPAPPPAPEPAPPPPPPVVQAEPPKDSDGDGVPDSIDRCPGTLPGVKVDAYGCEIDEVILRGVNFAFNSTVLTPDSATVLDGVVATLRQRPNDAAEVHGYTDSTGTAAYNQKLSQRRAEAVVDYFTAHGIPASQLTAKGFGAENPVATNHTAEGRAENRRVTVKFSQPLPR